MGGRQGGSCRRRTGRSLRTATRPRSGHTGPYRCGSAGGRRSRRCSFHLRLREGRELGPVRRRGFDTWIGPYDHEPGRAIVSNGVDDHAAMRQFGPQRWRCKQPRQRPGLAGCNGFGVRVRVRANRCCWPPCHTSRDHGPVEINSIFIIRVRLNKYVSIPIRISLRRPPGRDPFHPVLFAWCPQTLTAYPSIPRHTGRYFYIL